MKKNQTIIIIIIEIILISLKCCNLISWELFSQLWVIFTIVYIVYIFQITKR